MNKKQEKPTSPHLQIYKWSVASFSSIMHRFTGIVLYFSIIAICSAIVIYGNWQEFASNNTMKSGEHCDCWVWNLARYLIFCSVTLISFSLYYHFCNGIRHLFWDIGKGFNKENARYNGILVIISAIILTCLTVFGCYYFLGLHFKL